MRPASGSTTPTTSSLPPSWQSRSSGSLLEVGGEPQLSEVTLCRRPAVKVSWAGRRRGQRPWRRTEVEERGSFPLPYPVSQLVPCHLLLLLLILLHLQSRGRRWNE